LKGPDDEAGADPSRHAAGTSDSTVEKDLSMLSGKTILMGVSGGIAAYKAAELVRLLSLEGASVQVVMTANAQRFVTALTFQAFSGQPVCTDLFDLGAESEIGHIQVARRTHLALIAPATANVIAKMAAGIADDYLTTVLLAVTAPVAVCPAMNTRMYEHPATQRNLAILRDRGVHVVDPGVGSLACGEEGAGRLADLEIIVEAARRLVTPQSLSGRKILVSAGPTWEPFDPVRFITNPSSGKMGYALAAEASRRGAETHLVSGPSVLCPPSGVRFHGVVTAEEMNRVVSDLAPAMDAVIMAAAVSDFRPEKAAPQKTKKDSNDLIVRLVRTPDILEGLGSRKPAGQVLVGFAAETENLLENAAEKLVRKNLDIIVANDLTQPDSGFRCDTNRVKMLFRDGSIEDLPCMTKQDVARRVLDRIESLFAARERSSEPEAAAGGLASRGPASSPRARTGCES
jgi:phosphopantothenoylcysteine decarboxylase/phosphopantothenate--cysteine ligase